MPQELIGGRYRIERAVGQGGMGTVWLCQDEVLHRAVAVKQIGDLGGDSADHARRAMREARTAAALNHRNAVSIYDVVDHEGAPWLVMEYVPSQTLADLMSEGPMPVDRVTRIGAQVAAALASAHALGIIHRDVKPGNILVGEGDQAKISDFGIARLGYDDKLTQTGMVAGTPTYFSPELARGADPAAESDVWALGATLYAAVEGRPPYRKQSNPIATLQAIAAEPVERPSRAGSLLEPIGHMMDRDPASRWTMAQAEEALRQLVEDPGNAAAAEGTSVIPSPAPEPTPKEPVEAPEPDTRRQTPPPPPAQPAGRRRSRVLPVALSLAVLVLLGAGGYLLATALTGDDPSGNTRPTAGSPSPDRTASPPDGTPGESPDGTPAASESTPDASESTPDASESTPEESESTPDEDTSEPTPTQQDTPVSAQAAKLGAIESYFNTVPDDLDAGYAQLTPRYQQEVGDSYYGFWNTIDDVSVANTRVQGDAVIADITYVTDGSSQTETHRLSLVRQGGNYLIDDDEAIG